MFKQLVALSILVVIASLGFAQTCRSNRTETTPTTDFAIHGNGTVTHTKTGLMWMQCSLGQIWDSGVCSGTPTTYSWQDALQQAENTSFVGYNDWRLPNIEELSSIIELSCYGPSINLQVFLNTPAGGAGGVAWSSSSFTIDSSLAWLRNFGLGVTYGSYKGNSYSVRLVRGQ